MKELAVLTLALLAAAPAVALDAYPTTVIAEVGTQDD
jgi:hypothetical protein